MSVELKIEYLPVDALKPYEKNARKHTDADVQNIVASIDEFGFDDPIGIWGDENLIVEGHGRLLAAKKLGMETVPCIRLDHLTDEQRRAYALAHNKTAEMSEWDFDILPEELSEILDIDMSQFGFENEFISDEEIDGGDIVEKEKVQVAVKMIFSNSKEWRKHENSVRDFIDKMDGVSVSVGEHNAD